MRIDRFDGEFRFLSNFYYAEVALDGELYPSVEHAFQAAKTVDPTAREHVRNASTPAAAKRTGRLVVLRSGWEQIKIPIMRDLVSQKFSHPELRTRLLATGDAELVEGNWWKDRFWGVCDGQGENWLGQILMEVRAQCRSW